MPLEALYWDPLLYLWQHASTVCACPRGAKNRLLTATPDRISRADPGADCHWLPLCRMGSPSPSLPIIHFSRKNNSLHHYPFHHPVELVLSD